MVDGPKSGATERHLPWDAKVHKALSSPPRSRILALLRASEEDLDVEALAAAMDLHRNTVRTHLGVLEEAGLVVSQPVPRDRPGRPRHAYRATEHAKHVAEQQGGYRFLAEILTGYLASSTPDPARASEEAGAAWGRWLVDEPAPFTKVDREAGLEQLGQLLDDVGFAPEFDDDPDRPRLLLHRCPFLDLAREHQEVVCSIHLGLMRGALDKLGADVEVEDLTPFVEPSLCVSHLQPA